MKHSSLPVNGFVTVYVDRVGGDLQVVGWDRPEVSAKTNDNQLSLSAEGQNIHAQSDGDLILYVARDSNLRIAQVGGDADLRALPGSLEIESIGGDLQMHKLGSIKVKSVGSDMSLRGCLGDLQVDSVGGDASLYELKGNVSIVVGADLYLRGVEGNVQASAGADAALYLRPLPGMRVNLQAGSDILLCLPPNADVELDLQASDDEAIRIDLPGVPPTSQVSLRSLLLGAGGSHIQLQAGAEMIVTSRSEEWKNVAEFAPFARDDSFSPAEFPGFSFDFEDSAARLAQQAAQQAMDAAARVVDETDRVQRRVDAAMRRAEEKMRNAERRSMHMGIKIGRLGGVLELPRAPSPPPVAEPVTDAERLTILKMLEQKKISIAEAEKLLAALDGK